MVLGFGKRAKPDLYLSQNLTTERLELVNCGYWAALKVTLPWARDPEILNSLTYEKSFYPPIEWASRQRKPNGRSFFFHAIVDKETQSTIGGHRLYLDRSGSVSMAIALSDKTWWGKGVFEETRRAILDHFSRSPKVMRFSGNALARNFSSVYNYKKLGFRMIGYDRKSWLSPLTDEYHDTLYFEYLAEDWRKDRGLDLI